MKIKYNLFDLVQFDEEQLKKQGSKDTGVNLILAKFLFWLTQILNKNTMKTWKNYI